MPQLDVLILFDQSFLTIYIFLLIYIFITFLTLPYFFGKFYIRNNLTNRNVIILKIYDFLFFSNLISYSKKLSLFNFVLFLD